MLILPHNRQLAGHLAFQTRTSPGSSSSTKPWFMNQTWLITSRWPPQACRYCGCNIAFAMLFIPPPGTPSHVEIHHVRRRVRQRTSVSTTPGEQEPAVAAWCSGGGQGRAGAAGSRDRPKPARITINRRQRTSSADANNKMYINQACVVLQLELQDADVDSHGWSSHKSLLPPFIKGLSWQQLAHL